MVKVRAHVYVSGRVQGVFFRYETRREAVKRNVKGWVRNLPDGRVEAVFEGEKEDVEKEFFDFLNNWCKKDTFFSHNPPKWEFSLRWMQGTKISRNHPIVKIAKKVTEEVTNQEINVKGAPYPCDLFIFNLYANVPGIVIGPRGGNAHGEDEFVFIEDLVNLTKIFACIAMKWCGVK